MEAKGKLLKCDRCGEQVFLKWISEEEFDGGYTKIDKFEKAPEGWECVNRYFHKHDLRELCPKCSKDYEDIIGRFFGDVPTIHIPDVFNADIVKGVL